MDDNKKKGGFSIFAYLCAAINIYIGRKYMDDCNLDVPTYLMVAGGISFVFQTLWVIAMCTPCDCDEKIMSAITPLVGLAQVGIIIWGSILVFGAYSTWVYDENSKTLESPNYCGYSPFMYSFVMLIVSWCLIPFVVCCACFTACVSAVKN